MYEQFRGEFLSALGDLNPNVLNEVVKALDAVAEHYTIQRASTQLIVQEPGLPVAAKSYLVSRAIEGLSRQTLASYKTMLTGFFAAVRKPVDSITTNDIRMWMYSYEAERGISRRSMQTYREILSGFFRWANAQGWVPSNPMQTIKPIKFAKRERKAMAQIDLEYIRRACENDMESAIVELLYSTGCRVSELSVLKISDVDWDRREVTLFGKGQKYRTAYLNAKAFVALRRYLSGRNDDCDALIVTRRAPHHAVGKSGLERIVRVLCERVSDKLSVPVTPHVFRHTTATMALQNGMPVQDVQRMLGHANINTTMVYAEVQQDDVKTMHKKCVV